MLPRSLGFVLFVCSVCLGQTSVVVTTVDENGVAVPGVILELRGTAQRCVTDVAGHCRFSPPPGTYDLVASKFGFYQSVTHNFTSATPALQLTLAHTQEVKESVEVTASPPAVDPQQVAATNTIAADEIINIPFPVTRDIRQALPYIPGVVRDATGQIHVAGADTYQTLTLLDGFEISDPATGLLNTRFSTDAVRSIDIQSSRYSAQFGPASGGVAAFSTVSGDDRLRFSATNFIPSFSVNNGLQFDKIAPRATLSGPLVKGRAWFVLAPDIEYDRNIVNDIPSGQNRNTLLRLSNLAKLQVKLTPDNVVTASFLVNDLTTAYAGLSPFTPLESTLKEAHSSYFVAIRDQISLRNGGLIEAALAYSRYHDRALPLGTSPFSLSPATTLGNFYRSNWAASGRIEPQLNIYLPRYHWRGTHEIRFGAVARNTDNTATVVRTPFSILRADQSLFSRLTYSNAPRFSLSNTVYGAFVEDRWTPIEHLLVELGVRTDRDTLLDQATASPRIAATYMLGPATKLSAGIGLFHDYPTLGLLSRAYQGSRTQYFYDSSGTLATSVVTTTVAPIGHLAHAPASTNWSLGIEHQFAHGLIFAADYVDRHTVHDFLYDFTQLTPAAIQLHLDTNRTTHYRALQLTAHKVFQQEHELLLAYTRSTAHANAVLDYSLDTPVFNPQAPGPLPWDAPNKIVSWGFLPAPHFKKWSFGYSAEWRTGFPFTVINQFQQVVGAPNSRRFSDYLMINPFIERRFTLKGYQLALRGGIENITGSKNALVVQNNIDAPNFLQYGITAHRAFTARIRFLGKK